MSDKIEVYWLPHCTTCQKAAEELKSKNVEVAAWRDMKSEPLSRREVERLAEKVGGASELFSKRARKYRALGLDKRELSDDEMLQLMSDEYTFIKRPVIVRGNRATAGWTSKTFACLFGED